MRRFQDKYQHTNVYYWEDDEDVALLWIRRRDDWKLCLISYADLALVWRNGPWGLDGCGYACHTRNETKRVYLHRLIAKTPDGLVTDHINRNRLDNRRENLRAVTQVENGHNLSLARNNTSGLTGATYHKNRKCWVGHIQIRGKVEHLGCFDTAEEAHAAYLARKAEAGLLVPA